MPNQSVLKFLTLACCFLLPAIASGQERIQKVTVGPYGDQIRIVVAHIEPVGDGYKMQSLIIDLTPEKDKKQEPKSVQVDLTSTVRAVQSGKKDQKILVLRWKGGGDLELRCDGKWTKQEPLVAAQIVATVKAVIASVPLGLNTPTDVTLPEEIEQRVSAAFDNINAKDLPCVREVH